MTSPAHRSSTAAQPPTGKAAQAELSSVLTGRGYHALLIAAGVFGVPVALVAFFFLAAVTEAEHWVWITLPANFGWHQPPAWYPVLVVGLAGALVGPVIALLPGRGGHLPVKGLGGGTPLPVELPGVVLAAAAGLILGAVLGPEAPLTALGGGLVLLAADRTRLRDSSQGRQLLVVAGSAAAIATVFGNPLVAVVLMLEVVGLAGSQVLVVLLPCLVAAGLGDLVFTGLGHWTGLSVQSLTIPGVSAAHLDFWDLLWTVPIAVLAAIGAQLCRRLGLFTARITAHRTLTATIVAGLLVGACAAAYTLSTGRTVLDVVESGQGVLPALVSSPHSWSIATLLLLLAFKGTAYGLSLGSFRGGPTFPAVFLGTALGVLVGSLPGLGSTAGIAIAMTASTTAVLRLPVTSVVLVVLLLGTEGATQLPIVLLSAAIAMVTAVALDSRRAGSWRTLRRHTSSEGHGDQAGGGMDAPASKPRR